MGYRHFDGNDEDVMRVFLRLKEISIFDELVKDYPYQIKSLLSNKMIKKEGNTYVITERGTSAITQQLRDGEYWVAPLRPRKFDFGGTLKIPRSMAGYVTVGRHTRRI